MNESSPRPAKADKPQIMSPTDSQSGNPAGSAPFVVVLGMHRSGTSLCADALGRLGVRIADQPDAQPSNPRGQWERLEIVERHDRILEMLDRGFYSPLHDLPLPTGWWLKPEVVEIRREIVGFLEQKRDTAAPFGFKDPRTARLLPLWHQIFDELRIEPKIVLCIRNPAQAARSLEQRDGLPADLGELRWYVYIAEIFRHLRNYPVCLIEYEEWFAGDNLGKLARFFGLPQAESAPALPDIADRELRHDDPSRGEAQLNLVRSLYELARRYEVSAEARAEIAEMLDRLAAFEQLQQPLLREFEALSRLAAPVVSHNARRGMRSALSWREPALRAEWQKVKNASDEVERLRARLQQILQQRAELDGALARAQQQATLREHAAALAAQQLAALREQLRAREATREPAATKPNESSDNG